MCSTRICVCINVCLHICLCTSFSFCSMTFFSYSHRVNSSKPPSCLPSERQGYWAKEKEAPIINLLLDSLLLDRICSWPEIRAHSSTEKYKLRVKFSRKSEITSPLVFTQHCVSPQPIPNSQSRPRAGNNRVIDLGERNHILI